jgi:hypothetical protein
MDYNLLIDEYAEKYMNITSVPMFKQMLGLFARDILLRTAHEIQVEMEQKPCQHECSSNCRRKGCNCKCGDAHIN